MNNDSDNNEPRAYTPDEVRQILLLYFRTMVRYWATIKVDPADLAKLRESDVEYRLSGLVFSILNVFDGTANGLPAFDLIPSPHPDDAEYCKTEGSNWFERKLINEMVMLHDLWHHTK
jgi:hypothetical protein